MPTVDVFNFSNQKVGEIELSDKVFGAEVNPALLYEAVRHYQAGLRSGTAKTKVRGEVAGSGKKLWKQKGTGRARMGSIRSPVWRHGGTSHGPVPRDYSYSLPRKMQAGALRSALSAKLQDGGLKVIDSLTLSEPKSKTARAALDKFEAARKVLVVEHGENRNLNLAMRNLAGVTLLSAVEVTVYHLLGAERVLVSQAAARKLSEGLGK
jgi:large subunit ribosomal protein L4